MAKREGRVGAAVETRGRGVMAAWRAAEVEAWAVAMERAPRRLLPTRMERSVE